ncbi:amino acid adenylation domain-containing protein, partial [uncultured Shewanella sp.]|uniref:non-ribosomal peptide synthetase n=1 Tax=uncultured Shewanella sp. TaxID=173975 RepID=UPI0026355282
MSNISRINSSSTLFPFHSAQENVYFEQVILPNNPMYNIGCYSEVQQVYDLNKLQLAWQLLIDHADALRLELVQQDNGVPLQKILPQGDIIGNIEFIDFSDKSSPHCEAKKWMARQYRKVFRLDRGERFQLAVIKLSTRKCYLFSRFHHLFVDGIAVYRIYEQLNYIYSKVVKNESPHFIHYLPQYEVEVQKSLAYLQSNRYLRDKEYWQAFLNDRTPTYLPQYYKQQGSECHNIELSTQLSYQIRAFCEQSKLSVLTALMGGAALFFSRHLGLSDVVISTPLHGRRGQQAMRVIGMHSDAVMLALHINESWSFDTLLAESNKTFKRAIRYCQFPQSHLSRLNSDKEVLSSDISLNYELYDFNDRAFDIGEIVHLSPEDSHTPLEIRFIDFTDKDHLILRVNYHKQYFSSCEIERLADTLIRYIAEGIHDCEKPIYTLKEVSEKDCDVLLQRQQQSVKLYEEKQTVSQLFENQVIRTPDNLALVYNELTLTYRELNQRANQLAHYLRRRFELVFQTPLRADMLFALYLDRSVEMVISILAVMKAGGAYVPITPGAPQARVMFMIEDTAAPFIITKACYAKELNEWLQFGHQETNCTLVIADDESLSKQPQRDLVPIHQVSDLIYVIYTSGTTGKPKGVMIEHRSVSNLIFFIVDTHQLKSGTQTLFFSNYAFDASVFEIFPSLCSGSTMTIVPTQAQSDIDALLALIQQNNITKAFLPTAIVNTFSEALAQSNLEVLHTGGEVLHPLSCLPTPLFFNQYGPTETTVCATQKTITDPHCVGIGQAISNTFLYILNKQKALTAIGAEGELYIGGVGVARGYLNRPSLTKENFITDPLEQNTRLGTQASYLYKTGDLVRYLSDGSLMYLGRNDAQVKIRGHRIELGEIETALEEIGGIKQAVVIDYKSENSHFLAAFVVPEMAFDSIHFKNDRRSISRHISELALSLDTHSLLDVLVDKLPEYMIPSSVTVLDKIPLTMNGKLDKEALPEPILVNDEDYAPPRNEVERQLCQIWQEVLGLEQVGIHDNFFHIGGNSISAIRLNAKAREIANIDIPLAELFTHSNIALLAANLSHQQFQIPKRDVSLQTPLSFAQERLWFIEQFEGGSDAYHMPYLVRLRATT